MQKEIDEKKFIEHAKYSDNLYGTSIAAIENVTKAAGKNILLDIDVQGALQVKESSFKAHYVFVSPPSLEILERRLRDRGTESEETLKKRLEAAKREIAHKGVFDHVVTNDTLEKAYKDFESYLMRFT